MRAAPGGRLGSRTAAGIAGHPPNDVVEWWEVGEEAAMAQEQWTRVEGMVLAQSLDPRVVASDLAGRGVLADLDWFDRSPELLGLTVAQRDGRVALLDSDGQTLRGGPRAGELAEDLAAKYDAQVMLGEAKSDHLSKGADRKLAEVGEQAQQREDAPSRVVEIGRTPASSVPLLAAMEGVDIVDLGLPEGARALVAELPAEKSGWNFGDLPLVSLTYSAGEFQVYLVTDDDPENVVTYNWAMNEQLVGGFAAEEGAVSEQAEALVGPRADIAKIVSHVPGANKHEALSATHLRGDPAVRAFVAALGLPGEVAGFLLGQVGKTAIPGGELHLARGISTAIGHSVGMMLDQPTSPAAPLWRAYRDTAARRPWLVRIGASVEAALGASLVVLAVRTPAPRSGWTRLGGLLGGALVVDSLAEVSLSSWLAERRGVTRAAPGSGSPGPGR